MMEVNEAVKRVVNKLEGATQSWGYWGQIWGRFTTGGQYGGDKITDILRHYPYDDVSMSLIFI